MKAVKDLAREILLSLGYAMEAGDESFLAFCARGTEEEIRSACNLDGIPEGLAHAAAGCCAAEFLDAKRSVGKLDGLEGFDYAAAVKQVQEGDTSVSYFDAHSPEGRLEQLIARLRSGREKYAAYRRLKW